MNHLLYDPLILKIREEIEKVLKEELVKEGIDPNEVIITWTYKNKELEDKDE